MTLVATKGVISKERAERIAKGHACEHCGEYSYKKLSVKPPNATQKNELKESWHAVKVCGVCGLEQEMGIAADGDILYVN
jgi:transcription elongation factor Elf1